MSEPESVKKTETEAETVSVKSGGGKRGFKDKKKRGVVIAIACVVLALIIAGAVTAVVLLTREEETNYASPTELKQYAYYIDPSDTAGFYLDDSFRAEIPLDDMVRTVKLEAKGVTLTDDLRLYISGEALSGAVGIYEYSYKGATVAVINVKVTKIDGKISDAESLKAMKESDTYALAADIDMTGVTEGIEYFGGNLYGNHHEIKGLGIAGGLFTTLYGAHVSGIEFTSVNVASEVSAYGNYGVIAGTVRNSDISYCSLEGSYTLTAALGKNDIIYVGGIAGYVSSLARKNEAFDNLRQISYCVTRLALTVNATGDVKIGGIVGGAVNSSLRECYNYGSVTFTGTDAAKISGVYFGGLAGVLTKEYEQVNSFNELDEGARLYSYAALKATVIGDNGGITVCAGGIFGMVENHSVANSSFGGSLEVRLGKVASYVGGIAGNAVNNTLLTMRVRGVGVKEGASVSVYSLYNAYAGGIAGRFAGNVTYEKITGSVMPAITTDSSSNTGLHVASEGVARNENAV